MFKSVSLLLLRWLVFLFTPVLLFAQQNTIKQFTINEGLPSNEVYDVLEDSKGYIWLSTDRGVCRFDGYSFEKFTTQDGLKDNTVFSMHEDSLGKIWFLSYSPELCYYQNDRIHDYKFNDRIRKMNIGKSIKADFFTTGDTVFVYAPGRGYYWIAGDGRALFFEVAYGEKTANEASIISCQKTKEGVWEVQKNKQYVERDTSYINRMNSPRYVELINNMTFPWRVHDRFVKYADQKIRMWSNNLQLLFYQQDILVKQVRLKKKVTCITRDQKGRYWAALVDGGVGRYKSPMNAMEEEDHFFGNQTISAIEEDMEGGMWFSTINNGVYYLPPGLEFLLPLPKELPNFPVLDIARNTNKAVFISYSNGEIWKLTDKNEAQLLKKIEVGDMRKNYNPLVFLEKSNELVSGDEMKVRYLAASVELVKQLSVQRKFNYVADQIRPPIFSKAVVDEVGGFYAATNYGLVHFRSDQSVEGLYYRIKLINGKSEPVWMHRVDALLLQGGKVKYISSLEGVFEVRGDSMLFLGDDQPLLKGRFDTFLRGRDGNIYIGSRTKGLIVMRRDSLYHVNEDNGLSGNQVYAIEKGIKNCVWVGTNNGLCKLCLDKRGKATFKQITAAQGIISNGIRSLCYMGQQLYVGAENGLFKMQPDRVYRNQVAPRLHLTQVLINAEAVDFSDQPMVLKSSENQVQLNYSGITFRNPQHLYYQYRLDGIESAWQSTQNRTVRFDYLPSGRYTFRIKAVNEDGVASKEVLLEFEILQPLWLKWWFLLGIFLLLVGVVILIVQRRERQIRKVLEVERKMIELELKALRSQMNPHFTFNTLGAIQQYIMKRDPLVANNYIASFAKLIRKVLENSKDDHIILQEELDTIRLYLDLECIRFEGKLSYEIKVQSAVEATYLEIPPMIIQPYVENAILHGILPSERPGVVQIEVNTTPNGLHVIVRDNGIGRTRSSEMKHSDLFKGKSLGMKITSERLELIKESSNLIYNVEVADITGDENEIIGTEVTLIFPLDLNHDK